MGDGITESSAGIMAGVFDGDLQPLFDIILDNHADGFLRGEMFDALALVVLHDPSAPSSATPPLMPRQIVWWGRRKPIVIGSDVGLCKATSSRLDPCATSFRFFLC